MYGIRQIYSVKCQENLEIERLFWRILPILDAFHDLVSGSKVLQIVCFVFILFLARE
jgi:hypothetical protein